MIKINIKTFAKLTFIFTAIFFINFLSIFFFWIKNKFGAVDYETLIYHFELIKINNLFNPNHHLTESFIYFNIKLNFIISFFIFLFWIGLKKLNTFAATEKKNFSTQIFNISNKLIKLMFIWIILILILFFSSWSFFNNLKSSNIINLSQYFRKINTKDINKINNKNLILIYTESLDASLKNLNKKNSLPNLNFLADEYISVDKFVQLTGTSWTIAGIFSSQCGLPLINIEYIKKDNLSCLPDILKNLKYKNYFLLGHDSKFQNYDRYLKSRYDIIIDLNNIEKNYDYDLKKNKGWGQGYNDNVLFDISKKILKKSKETQEKFFLTILTSDTHGPLGIRQNDCKYKYIIQTLEETLECFDRRLKNFIDYLIPIYGEDTLIVVISDHLMMNGMRFYKDYFDKGERHMTNIFITDELIKKKFNRNIINHFDIFPTILNLMNVYNNSRLGLGVSLLDDAYKDNHAKINNDKFNKLQSSNFQEGNFFD